MILVQYETVVGIIVADAPPLVAPTSSTVEPPVTASSAVPSTTAASTNVPTTADISNRVDAMRRPELISQPSDVHVETGNRVYMNCAAYGTPQPRIAWFHNEYVHNM